MTLAVSFFGEDMRPLAIGVKCTSVQLNRRLFEAGSYSVRVEYDDYNPDWWYMQAVDTTDADVFDPSTREGRNGKHFEVGLVQKTNITNGGDGVYVDIEGMFADGLADRYFFPLTSYVNNIVLTDRYFGSIFDTLIDRSYQAASVGMWESTAARGYDQPIFIGRQFTNFARNPDSALSRTSSGELLDDWDIIGGIYGTDDMKHDCMDNWFWLGTKLRQILKAEGRGLGATFMSGNADNRWLYSPIAGRSEIYRYGQALFEPYVIDGIDRSIEGGAEDAFVLSVKNGSITSESYSYDDSDAVSRVYPGSQNDKNYWMAECNYCDRDKNNIGGNGGRWIADKSIQPTAETGDSRSTWYANAKDSLLANGPLSEIKAECSGEVASIVGLGDYVTYVSDVLGIDGKVQVVGIDEVQEGQAHSATVYLGGISESNLAKLHDRLYERY